MIAFRTNANSKSGLGHLSRCIHLARKLECDFDLKTLFIVDKVDEVSGRFLRNFQTVQLYRSNQCFSGEFTDAKLTRTVLSEFQIRCIVIDDYRLSYHYEQLMYKALKVVVIEDLENRDHLCDLLVDGRYTGTSLISKHDAPPPRSCKRLIGHKYMILNPNLKVAINQTSSKPDFKHVIMLSLGGGNVSKQLYLVLQHLIPIVRSRRIDIIPVISSKLYLTPELTRIFNEEENISPIIGSSDLTKVYPRCSIYVGALGTTAYEANYCQVPTVTFSFAPNQLNCLGYLSELGFHLHCNTLNLNNPVKFLEKLVFLIENYAFCRTFYTTNKGVELDLNGTQRIAKEISNLLISKKFLHQSQKEKRIRPSKNYAFVKVADKDFFHHLDCRNLAFNRTKMVNDDCISLNAHLRWWFRNSRISYVLTKNNRKLCYIWHQVVKSHDKSFLIGGWFACHEDVTAIDILQGLNQQIKCTDAEFPDLCWLAVIKRSNYFVKKVVKRFRFQRINENSALLKYFEPIFPNIDFEYFDAYIREPEDELL